MKRIALAAAAVSLLITPAFALTAQEEANKKIVVDMMTAMSLQDVDKAASYLRDDYIQHNPNVQSGKEAYISFFKRIWPNGPKPGPAAPFELVLTEGNYVTIMAKHKTPEPDDPTKTYDSFWFDIFRVQDGKIAEHWDGAMKPVKK